jgi:hypothetical protein
MNLPTQLTPSPSAPILSESLPLPDRYPEASLFCVWRYGWMQCHFERSALLPKQPEAAPTLEPPKNPSRF